MTPRLMTGIVKAISRPRPLAPPGCCAGGRGATTIPTTSSLPTASSTIPAFVLITSGFVVRVGLWVLFLPRLVLLALKTLDLSPFFLNTFPSPRSGRIIFMNPSRGVASVEGRVSSAARPSPPAEGSPPPLGHVSRGQRGENGGRRGGAAAIATLLRSPLLTKALNDPKVQDFLKSFQH